MILPRLHTASAHGPLYVISVIAMICFRGYTVWMTGEFDSGQYVDDMGALFAFGMGTSAIASRIQKPVDLPPPIERVGQ